jgi:hypothetical protein
LKAGSGVLTSFWSALRKPELRLADARRWEREGGETDLDAFSTERPRVMPSALEWAVTELVLMKSMAHGG